MLRFITYLCGIVALLFLLGTGLIYTKPGLHLINMGLNKYLSSQGTQVHLEHINSLFPLELTVRDFSFDDKGALEVNAYQIQLSFDAWQALFHHKLEAKIEAKEIEVLSHSVTKERQEKGKDPTTSFDYDLALQLTMNTFSYKHVENDHKPLSVVTNQGTGKLQYTRRTGEAHVHFKSEARKNQENSIGVEVKAEGTIDDFALSYRMAIPYFTYQAYGASNISMGGEIEHLPLKPKGLLSMQAHIDEWGPLSVKTTIEPYDAQFRLFLEELNLPFARISGHVKFSPDISKIKGSLTSIFEGVPSSLAEGIKGKGRIKVDFNRDGSSLSAHVKGHLSKAAYRNYSVEALTLEAKGDHILENTRSAKIDIRAQKMQIPKIPLLEKIVIDSEIKEGKGHITMDVDAKEGTAKLKSSLKQKDNQWEIRLEKLAAIYQKMPLDILQAEPILISPQDILIPKLTFSFNREKVMLSFMKREDSLSGQISGSLNLARISDMFLPSPHYLAGNVTADIHLSGTLAAPSVRGTLTLVEGEYENVEEGVYLDHIQTRAQFNGSTVTIPKLLARSHRTGEIQAKGQIDFIKRNVDLTLNSKDIPLIKTPALTVALAQSQLSFKGPLDKIICKGTIEVGNSKINLNALRLQEVKTLNFVSSLQEDRALITKEKGDDDASKSGVLWDLTINAPPVIMINGRGLESTWKGDFSVTGDLLLPQIKGALLLTKGTMSVFGNTLEISRGNIVFSGDKKNIPFIDISGHIQKNGYDLRVGVTGSLQNLHFSFTSTPELPKEEVLSQILFGKISRDLSPLEAIQLADSLHKMFGSGESMDVMGALAHAVGVDEISIATNEGKAAPTVKIKKKLSDKVQVRFEQSADLEENKVAVETALTDNISAKVEHGFMRPNDTVALMYSKDY